MTRKLISVALAFIMLIGLTPYKADAANEGVTIFGDISGEEIVVSTDNVAINLSTKFAVKVPGTITKARLYTSKDEKGHYTVEIWSVLEEELAAGPYDWEISKGVEGWQEFELPEPLKIEAGRDYLIAIRNNDESTYYSFIPEYFKKYDSANSLFVTQHDGGVFTTADTIPSNKNLITWPAFLRDVVFVPDEIKAPPKQMESIADFNSVYVSDLKLGSSYSYNSLLSIDMGSPSEGLAIGSTMYDKGLAMWASSHEGDAFVEINIEGLGFKTFASYVGVGDLLMVDNSEGTVIFIVEVDGREVARSNVCKYGDEPVLLSADITDGKVLRLSVSDAGDGTAGDLAVWADAVVSKSVDMDEVFKDIASITPEPTPTKTPKKTETATTQTPQSNDDTDNDDDAFPYEIVILASVVVLALVVLIVLINRRKRAK